MVDKGDRIDGWKSIAAFFGRERTTVVRWARHRGMPVRALPGGKTRTVYALRSELEAWSRSSANVLPADYRSSSQQAVPLASKERWHLALRLTLTVIVLVATFTALLGWRSNSSPSQAARAALPANPAAAAMLLQAATIRRSVPPAA